MNFVSIDFETANETRTSACSIGITVVKNNKIIENFEKLIKPKENRFKPMNIWIHGITEEVVEHEKEFNELWPSLKKYFENSLIIAHNAYFDIEVLLTTLNLYGLNLKNCCYLCTVDISKRVYDGIPDNKLATLGEMLNLKFKHHNAADDSMVAAEVFINVCKYLGIEKFSDIKEKLGITPGLIFNNNNCLPIKDVIKIKKKQVSLIENDNLKTKYFQNKNVVFTGPLKSMSRAKASAKIKTLGGFTSNTVKPITNIIITNLSLNQDFLTSKLRKVKYLIESGLDIIIINEEEFLNILNEK